MFQSKEHQIKQITELIYYINYYSKNMSIDLNKIIAEFLVKHHEEFWWEDIFDPFEKDNLIPKELYIFHNALHIISQDQLIDKWNICKFMREKVFHYTRVDHGMPIILQSIQDLVIYLNRFSQQDFVIIGI